MALLVALLDLSRLEERPPDLADLLELLNLSDFVPLDNLLLR